MASPEYVVCLECESPNYVFEWKDGEVVECVCEVCGDDEPTNFVTPDDFDSLTGDDR